MAEREDEYAPGPLDGSSHRRILGIAVPAVEVHLSNLYAREAFRHQSVTGTACEGVIMGLGPSSYHLALHHLAARLGAEP